MMIFDFIPNADPQCDPQANVDTIKFGENYEQRISRGINTIKDQWTLNFNNRKKAEGQAIIDFLKSRGGTEAFLWTNPEGKQVTVVCKKWPYKIGNGGFYSLSVVFEQVFE